MKKITFLFTILFAVSVSFGQDLITSGGFEGLPAGNPAGNLTGTTSPWQSPSGGVRVLAIDGNQHSGTQFLTMDNDFRTLRQSFTATPGTDYTVTVWYFFPSPQGTCDPDDGIYLSIRQDTGGNGTQFDPILGAYIDPSINEATWQQITFDFTAPQANLLFFAGKQARNADGDGGNNNTARIDDISIVEKALSVTDIEKFNFNAIPNPATDIIRLSADQIIENVEIYSILGQRVFSKASNELSTEINISELSKGIYIVRTQIDNAVGSYKLIKQ